MKKIFLNIAACSLFAIALNACTKDKTPEYNTVNKGTVTVEFDNVVGNENLVLRIGEYTNASGEKYKVDILKYYVSNFVLTNIAGEEYIVPQDSSYFIIDESDASYRYATLRVPEGEYVNLSFILGVDSTRSTLDVSERRGVLDPTTEIARGMWWEWNQGYIFFKMEGTSPASSMGGNAIMYHIGGFGGYNSPTVNNIRTVSINLNDGGNAKVTNNKKSNIHLMVDINQLFDGRTVSIASMPNVMKGANSSIVANRFARMFKHDHTEN